MEALKDLAQWAAIVFGVGTAWGDSLRRAKNLEKRIDRVQDRQDHQEDKCSSAGYITMGQHDKLQRDCQLLWQSELAHINSTLVEIKRDLKELRNSPNK